MGSTHRSPAIVLRRRNLREADRIVTLYTRTHGKVAAIARGVKKPTSRLAGHLELGTVVDLSFAEGKGDLYTVTGAQGITPMVHASGVIDVLPVFTHFLEVVDQMTQDAEPDTRLYDLLSSTLQQLDLMVLREQSRAAALRASFDLSLLRLLGLLPELRACVSCRAELFPVENRLSFQLGGVLCPNCVDEDHGSVAISVDVLKLLRYFATSEGPEMPALYIPAKTQASLFFVLDQLFAYLLSREIASSKFRRAVEKLHTGPSSSSTTPVKKKAETSVGTATVAPAV
ncbi:MAG: DNA repair protein RecO [Candidatus Andersenbacteria bacterium]|nr:DNA repair protein RecO [Candidatus Andersenbacteria bacterium]